MSHSNTRVQVPNYSDGSRRRGNDSATLKLPRRGVVDDDPYPSPSKNIKKYQKKDGQPLVSYKKLALIDTFIIRTVRERCKRLELATQFLESGMEF